MAAEPDAASTRPSERSRTVVLGLIGFAIVVGLVVCAFFLLPKIGLEASLLWTAVIGGIAWLIRSNVERTRAHESLLAQQKREQYYGFLEFLQQALAAGKAGKEVSFDTDELRRWSLRMGLIGSDDVVRAWNLAKGVTDAGGRTPEFALRPWARLLVAMRRDCGHYETKLRPSELLELFVNDIGEYRVLIDA